MQVRAGVGSEGLLADETYRAAIPTGVQRFLCRERHERLHQNFVRATHNRVLHLLQIVLHLIEPIHALLEMTRQTGE